MRYWLSALPNRTWAVRVAQARAARLVQTRFLKPLTYYQYWGGVRLTNQHRVRTVYRLATEIPTRSERLNVRASGHDGDASP